MSETLGGRLRKQREERNVSLTAISEETKIAISLLEGLERDDVSRWPTGIFRRAFVRSYARAIGLDSNAVLVEFASMHPEPIESASAAESPTAADATVDEARGFRRRFSNTFRALASDRNVGRPMELGRLVAGDRPVAPVPDPKPEPRFELDLRAAASVCTRLAQVRGLNELDPLLDEMRRLLDARGIILWRWHPDAGRLAAVAGSGYSPELLSQLPMVGCDADNATAAAYRSGDSTIVSSTDSSHGAIVAPSRSPLGVVGVLAVEVPARREREPSAQSAATIWAAQLATLLADARAEDVLERRRAV
jgi:transcriptional regulator with XRE-family HTH domain